MNKVTILRSTLVETLTENRDAHAVAFADAIKGYKGAAIKAARRLAEKIEEDVDTSLYIHMDKPEDHTRDYDRVLRMLGLHEDDKVTISAEDFTHYVEDDWAWTVQFTATTARYSS